MQAGALLDRKLLNGEREEKPKVILQAWKVQGLLRKIQAGWGTLTQARKAKSALFYPPGNLDSLGFLFSKLLLPVSNFAFLLLCGVSGRVSIRCVRCMALKRLGLNERAVFIEVCILRTSSTCLRLPCVCIAMTCPCRACRSVQNMPVVGLVTPFSLKEESRPE